MEKTKKKILYVITKSNWGGAQRYVYDLATNLPKNEFEMEVILGGEGELKTRLIEAGIKTTNIPGLERDLKFFQEFAVFWRLLKIFRQEKPDVVHLNSSKIGGLGSFAARLYNLISKISRFFLQATSYKLQAKIIFTAHGWAFKEKRSFIAQKTIEFLSWLTVLFSDKIICVSKDDYEKISVFPFAKEKTLIIHNGIRKIELKTKEEARKIISAGENIGTNSLWLGCIAELHKNKGLEYGIEAVSEIIKTAPTDKKISFIVISDGEEKEKLNLLIKVKGLENNVFLVGRIENASSLLPAFDIFLLPSIKEGLPYVLLEAGMAKLPVIASDVGGIPEIIEDMKSGILVKSKRSDEIEKALEFLLSHKEKWQEFSKNLYQKTSSDFSLEKMLQETISVYEN